MRVELGMNELLKRVSAVSSASSGGKIMNSALERIGKRAKEAVVSVTPVKTGRLKSSYTVRTGGDCVYIENTASYARHVNYGHRQQVGRYVPAIGKRLVRPYVPGSFFFERGMTAVKNGLRAELVYTVREMLSAFKRG